MFFRFTTSAGNTDYEIWNILRLFHISSHIISCSFHAGINGNASKKTDIMEQGNEIQAYGKLKIHLSQVKRKEKTKDIY